MRRLRDLTPCARTVLLCGLLLSCGGSEAAAGPPESPAVTRRLDEIFSCQPRDPSLAALPDGGSAVSWISESRRVALRRFSPHLEPVGPEVLVAERPPGSEGAFGRVAVAVSPNGPLAVAWTDTRSGLRLRIYDADLTPRTEVLAPAGEGPAEAALDLLALPDGSFLAVWSPVSKLEALRLSGFGEVLVRFTVEEDGGSNIHRVHPSAVALGDRVVFAWTFRQSGFPFPFALNRHRVFGLDGTPLGSLGELPTGSSPLETNLRLLGLGSGGLAATWASLATGTLRFRAFDGTGTPLSAEVGVHPLGDFSPSANAMAELPDGSVRVVFLAGDGSGRVLLRRMSPQGRALGPTRAVSFGEQALRADGDPAAITLGNGDTLVAVRHELPPVPFDPVPCPLEAGLFARVISGSNLILADRFLVEVAWHDEVSGDRGIGQPGPQTPDTGSFWFFDESNLELVVKIVDGRPLNDHWWLFYAGLSNVAYRLTVTDLESGAQGRYDNPQGRLASVADTAAFADLFPDLFPDPGAGATSRTASASAPLTSEESAAGPCSPADLPIPPRPGLCLNDRRFEVEVEWMEPRSGARGVGRPIPVNGVTGAFWFFHPDGIDLVVKVLDGRPVNGRFWVFYGSLTDVEYRVRLRHTETGDEVVFNNRPFLLASAADTSSLTPPPCDSLQVLEPVCGFDGVTYDSAARALCEGWVGVAHPGECEAGDGGS